MKSFIDFITNTSEVKLKNHFTTIKDGEFFKLLFKEDAIYQKINAYEYYKITEKGITFHKIEDSLDLTNVKVSVCQVERIEPKISYKKK